MKKATLPPFLLLAGLMLVVALACSINFVAPVETGPLTPGEVTDIPTATDTPTLPPTFTPTNTPIPPTFTPTLTATTEFVLLQPIFPLLPSDTPPPQLDYSQPPNYGSANLTSGFTPDPYMLGMTSGGSVDVSYLGSGCSGFATRAPDLRLNFTAGVYPTLRIYFIGGQDTTLIVNTPVGSYLCADDSFGTVSPTIDINSPAGGSYDIWVGSYSSGTYVSGTLYITENTGNHP